VKKRKNERMNEGKDGRSRRAAPDSFIVQLGFHVQGEKKEKGEGEKEPKNPKKPKQD
jgi:hypothetical protein